MDIERCVIRSYLQLSRMSAKLPFYYLFYINRDTKTRDNTRAVC